MKLIKHWDVSEPSFDLNRSIGDTALKCDGFDPALILTIVVLSASRANVVSMKKLRMPPEPRLNLLIVEILSKIIKDRQHDYSTSMAEDRELLLNGEMPPRKRMAIEIRLGEKEILAAAIGYLDRKSTQPSTTICTTSQQRKQPPSPTEHQTKRPKV